VLVLTVGALEYNSSLKLVCYVVKNSSSSVVIFFLALVDSCA
jgi:hypothetical protein